MKKTKESIQRKYNDLFNEVVYRCKCKSEKKAEELRRKEADNFSRQFQKYQRKLDSYIKKKQQEYKRKCANEIRKLEWKEERVYKKKEKKFNKTEFVMELVQENAKLRDTDSEWNGFCISCNKLKSWWELAGWHRYSRSIKNICTMDININAQCHTCNRTTWPRWDTVAKERCNHIYDENLDKKYWEWTSKSLYRLKEAYFINPHGPTYGCITSDEWIEKAIEENEERWKMKSFYKPKKKWREIREKQKDTSNT